MLCQVCLAAFAALGLDGALPGPDLVQLDLEPFEDDDCIEVPEADELLALMHELCDRLDQALVTKPRSEIWTGFDAWAAENVRTMHKLAGAVLGRPYCEPVKLAWMAMECLLLIRGGEEGAQESLKCAAGLDEDLLEQMTPRGKDFMTRLHLVLRSPWPGLRLMDLLVRLHPETGSTRMGGCRAFQKWNSDPDRFDWPGFKPLVTTVADVTTAAPQLLHLRPEDGPLSRQYRARWLRLHRDVPAFKEALSFADDVFEQYREHHYQAGCHLGVISSYVMQLLAVHLRDVEGRVQRYTASVAQLINIHAQLTYVARTDWPVFRLLHIAGSLQRTSPNDASGGSARSALDKEPRAQAGAARRLCRAVGEAARSAQGEAAYQVVYVTSAWGHLAQFAARVLERWLALVSAESVGESPLLVFLALDRIALHQCEGVASGTRGRAIRCVDAPQRLGVEAAVAKYLALASVTQMGSAAVWLDLDVYLLREPSAMVQRALAADGAWELAFARHHTSESLSPAVILARGSANATDLLMRYACWLRENPYLLDHQGWDHFYQNRKGDYAAAFDYKGRNITKLEKDTGPDLSFLPLGGLAPAGARHAFLEDAAFSSGDGWSGRRIEDLVVFHFWGADQTQAELFELFYPHGQEGSTPQTALDVLQSYRRVLVAGPRLSTFVARGSESHNLHLVAISYADGCCQKSLALNRRKALEAGVREARSYGRKDLDPEWATRQHAILSQKKGGGWWLWKPHVILRTLKDPVVPWHRGVVIWVDAGNYLHTDPTPLISDAMRESDVVAMRLKWCMEAEWTSPVTLRQLNVSERYALVDGPQIGAYFLMFRKTERSIAFVEDWLRRSEDPLALLGAAHSSIAAPAGHAGQERSGNGDEPDYATPGFQKHQADQSVLSILFKQYGFKAVSLEEGHKYVTLARWRE